jgi:hypothetical protein
MLLFAGGLSDRVGSITIMHSVAKLYFPGKKFVEFNYFMGSGSAKTEYHGVLSIDDNGCLPVVGGTIVMRSSPQSPHTFLKLRHPGRTASNGIRAYSAPSIIIMAGKTLAEWKKLGQCRSTFTVAVSSFSREFILNRSRNAGVRTSGRRRRSSLGRDPASRIGARRIGRWRLGSC